MLKLVVLGVAATMGAWHLTRRLTRKVPRIFILHRFSEHHRDRFTSADEFDRFLTRTAQECDIVSVHDLFEQIDRGVPTPRPRAAITVDDGYADFHSIAAPILVDRKMSATLYATSGFIDGQCWMWWDALRVLIEEHPTGTLELQLTARTFRRKLSGAASRTHAWSEIGDHLVSHNEDRALALAQLEAATGITLPARPPEEYAPMTWQQVRECHACGIEIGGHTMTHAFLPTLDEAQLRYEIHDAKVMLEQNLAAPVTTFAYPNGMPSDCSPRVIEAVQEAGFRAALQAHPRPFHPNDRFRVGRWSGGPVNRQLGLILNGASILKMSPRLHEI